MSRNVTASGDRALTVAQRMSPDPVWPRHLQEGEIKAQTTLVNGASRVKTRKTPPAGRRESSPETSPNPCSPARSLQNCEKMRSYSLSHPVPSVLDGVPHKLTLQTLTNPHPRTQESKKWRSSQTQSWLKRGHLHHIPCQPHTPSGRMSASVVLKCRVHKDHSGDR